MQLTGIVAGPPTVFTYSNFEDWMHFPFTYNNTYTDTWSATFVSGGYNFTRSGSTTVTADSYGTLITPNGTYTNVLRVHFVQVYQDSTYIGTPYIITYNNDEYMWYKDGVHSALAAVFNLTTSASAPSSGGIYLTGSVGINELPNYITSYSVFPNPAIDKITINFTLTENKKVDILLFNSLGQKMEINQNTNGFQGLNSVQLNVATLPKGIYFAQVLLDGNIAVTKRFVINK